MRAAGDSQGLSEEPLQTRIPKNIADRCNSTADCDGSRTKKKRKGSATVRFPANEERAENDVCVVILLQLLPVCPGQVHHAQSQACQCCQAEPESGEAASVKMY